MQPRSEGETGQRPVIVVQQAPVKLLLTVEETCQALGVGRDSVLKLFDRGRRGDLSGLRTVHVGRRVLCPVNEVLRWLQSEFAEEHGDDLPPLPAAS